MVLPRQLGCEPSFGSWLSCRFTIRSEPSWCSFNQKRRVDDVEDDLRDAIDRDDEPLIASLGRQLDDLERLHPRSATRR